MAELPFPYFLVDDGWTILHSNAASRRLWPNKSSLAGALDEEDAARLWRDAPEGEVTTNLDGHAVTIYYRREAATLHLWLVNREPLVLLEEQLKKALRPDLKLFRSLESLLATIRGQSELMSVMLEHGDEFTVDQLKVIRGCQSDINARLAQCEELIANSRRPRNPSRNIQGKTRLTVVHRDTVRAELLAELFQLENWHVEVFTSFSAAARYVRSSADAISVMICESHDDCVDELLARNSAAQAVVIGDINRIDARLTRVPSDPLDINELQEIVFAMLSKP